MFMPTVSLWVRLRNDSKTDRLGNSAKSFAEPIQVHNCLFAPTTPADLAVQRPNGVKVSAVAYFPVGTTLEFTGALVSLDNKRYYKVIGEPVSYPCIANRGRWDTQVVLERYDG